MNSKLNNNGDGELGMGDWGLGIGPNPQSPIPNPQSPIPNPHIIIIYLKIIKFFSFKYLLSLIIFLFFIIKYSIENYKIKNVIIILYKKRK